MSNKINKSDSAKTGMVEASEQEQQYFESYPKTAPLTLPEIVARSRKRHQKVDQLLPVVKK